MVEIKDGEQFHTYFHVMFSDKVKTNEQLINMMMEKLSFDCRVEEWSYIQDPEATIAKLTDYWQGAKGDLTKAQAEVKRLKRKLSHRCPSCNSTDYRVYPATYVCADCGSGWDERENGE